MTGQATNLLALRDAKSRARDLLTLRYSEGLIDADELERRLEVLEFTEAISPIEALVADIVEPGISAQAFLVPAPAPISRALHTVRPPRRDDTRVEAAFATVVRDGPWTPHHHVDVNGFLAELNVDFTDARLEAGFTVINLNVDYSIVRIIVPPGLAVDVDLEVTLGSVRRELGIPFAPAFAEQPSLVLTGSTFVSRVHLRLGVDQNLHGPQHSRW